MGKRNKLGTIITYRPTDYERMALVELSRANGHADISRMVGDLLRGALAPLAERVRRRCEAQAAFTRGNAVDSGDKGAGSRLPPRIG
jgi:hypothetical protein